MPLPTPINQQEEKQNPQQNSLQQQRNMNIMQNLAQKRANNQRLGTGFTNLQKFRQANDPTKLGQAVSSGLVGLADKAKEQANQQIGQFKQQLGQEKSRIENLKNVQIGALQRLSGITRDTQTDVESLGPSQEELQSFADIRSGEFRGPETLDLSSSLAQAQEARQLAGLGSSEAGRQALLQKFAGGRGYTQGLQKLDSMLLGQKTKDITTQAKQEAGQLLQRLPGEQMANLDEAGVVRNTLTSLRDETINKLDTMSSGYEGDITKQLEENKAEYLKSENPVKALMKTFQDKKFDEKALKEAGLRDDQIGLYKDIYNMVNTGYYGKGSSIDGNFGFRGGTSTYYTQLGDNIALSPEQMKEFARLAALKAAEQSRRDANLVVHPNEIDNRWNIEGLKKLGFNYGTGEKGGATLYDVNQFTKEGASSAQQLAAINALKQLRGEQAVYSQEQLKKAGEDLKKRAFFDTEKALGGKDSQDYKDLLAYRQADLGRIALTGGNIGRNKGWYGQTFTANIDDSKANVQDLEKQIAESRYNDLRNQAYLSYKQEIDKLERGESGKSSSIRDKYDRKIKQYEKEYKDQVAALDKAAQKELANRQSTLNKQKEDFLKALQWNNKE